jgi:hypothetical protein
MDAVIPIVMCVTACVSLLVLPFWMYSQAPKTIFKKALRRLGGKRLLIYFIAFWEAWLFALTLLLAMDTFWPSANTAPFPLLCLTLVLACVGVIGILWTEHMRKQLQKLG